MMRHTKHAVTALGAVALLAVLVGAASANHLSFSSQTIRATWRTLEFRESFSTVRCAVTVEGTLHSATFAKTIGSLIGYITRASVSHPCTGGTVWAENGGSNELLGGTVPSTLPWHLVYEGFEGTLPNISGIRVGWLGASFLVRGSLATLCEYVSSSTGGILRLIIRPNGEHIYEGTINSRTGGCGSVTVSGTGEPLTVLGSTSTVTYRLI